MDISITPSVSITGRIMKAFSGLPTYVGGSVFAVVKGRLYRDYLRRLGYNDCMCPEPLEFNCREPILSFCRV